MQEMQEWRTPQQVLIDEMRELERSIESLQSSINSEGQISSRSHLEIEYTPERVVAEGLAVPMPDYQALSCEYCGGILHQRGLYISLVKAMQWLGHEDCACEGACKARLKQLEEMRARYKECQAGWRRWRTEQRIQASGLGPRFMGRTFANFNVTVENRDAYESAKQYADTFEVRRKRGDGLYFAGSYGIGKTHLVAAIALELMATTDHNVVFTTGVGLLSAIRATYDTEGESEEDALDRYKDATLLIIDDLGKENPTSWALSMIYDIINARYESNQPVIITTNYDDNTLVRRLRGRDGDMVTAEAIVSRLHEMTYAVPMTGQDRRSAEIGEAVG